MNKARFTGEEELRGRAAGKDPFCQNDLSKRV